MTLIYSHLFIVLFVISSCLAGKVHSRSNHLSYNNGHHNKGVDGDYNIDDKTDDEYLSEKGRWDWGRTKWHSNHDDSNSGESSDEDSSNEDSSNKDSSSEDSSHGYSKHGDSKHVDSEHINAKDKQGNKDSDVTCVEKEIGNHGQIPDAALIHDAQRITSVTVKKKLSLLPCVARYGYGFTSHLVWTKFGCKAKFTVCYIKEVHDQICKDIKLESPHNHYKEATIGGAIKVTSIKVKRRNTVLPKCFINWSFGISDTSPKVWVNKGCKATFSVCYIHNTTTPSPRPTSTASSTTTQRTTTSSYTTTPASTATTAITSTLRPTTKTTTLLMSTASPTTTTPTTTSPTTTTPITTSPTTTTPTTTSPTTTTPTTTTSSTTPTASITTKTRIASTTTTPTTEMPTATTKGIKPTSVPSKANKTQTPIQSSTPVTTSTSTAQKSPTTSRKTLTFGIDVFVTEPTPNAPIDKDVSCYQCGNDDGPCKAIDLLIGSSSKCPPGKGFCMVDVSIVAGQREVVKRCVDEPTCYTDWYQGSSDRSQCVNFNPLDTRVTELSCNFCCQGNGCNRGYKPDVDKLYKP